MHLSVSQPVSRAIDRARLVLFSPFDFGKWLRLAFCAFLVTLGEGGLNLGGNFNSGGGGGPMSGTRDVTDWISDNVALFAAIALAGLIVVLALRALFTWLSARGSFMFIDGIVRNRGAVSEPWRTYRDEGNNLFKTLFIVDVVATFLALLLAGGALAVAWSDLEQERFGTAMGIAAIGGGLLLLVMVVSYGVVQTLLRDFVAPIMYKRRVLVGEAWGIMTTDVLAGRGGNIVQYILMKIVLAIVIAIIAIAVMLLTCCIGALPYVSSVVLLPLLVFARSYPLCFLEQLGDGWGFFTEADWARYCARCGYDLQGNVSGVCPECGTPVRKMPPDDTPPPPNPPTMPPAPPAPPWPPNDGDSENPYG